MFMFRKKKAPPASSIALQKEAKKFQDAVTEINTKFVPGVINYDVVRGVAEKHGVDVQFVAGSFEAYLKRNALTEIRKIKATVADYTVLNLEQAAQSYGFELDDLNVTYFSED